ncbi:hypothetical protein B4U84_29725 [Westiellopsis prolifica IICB1]|nr:hypothetical protein B4U84_29725 [Westiellopsis prolifica IICB1]
MDWAIALLKNPRLNLCDRSGCIQFGVAIAPPSLHHHHQFLQQRIITEWGKVTVTWWTHAIQGLHRNDFIMAAKTDAITTEFAN